MSGVQPPPGVGNIVEQFAQEFTTAVKVLLGTIDSTVIDLSRLAYVTLLMLGLLLYFTHIERRLGKDLIKGGVALAVISEFVFPYLAKL
jgi:hypothetical protein